jgi:AmmeMemoRadiSam system protein A
MLADHERQTLLRIAREAVTACAHAREVPSEEVWIERSGGAFVTLRVADTLRGCIGHVEVDRPLVDFVRRVAAAAASEDPRFPPLRPPELSEVVIEISVLGPLEICPGPAHIEVGRHGLVVVEGAHRGLLLPQVAVERGWDSHTFLSQTCVKAGLKPSAWQSGLQIFTFEAEVFREGRSQ